MARRVAADPALSVNYNYKKSLVQLRFDGVTVEASLSVARALGEVAATTTSTELV